MSTDLKHNHVDFELYNQQLDCPTIQDDCVAANVSGTSAAWTLDKYKFVHMLEETWRMRPGRDWYVFIEADTYVFWPSLVRWLRTVVDPREKLYMGAPSWVRNIAFAHGGSGYVVSGALLESLIHNHANVAAKYDDVARGECCGDFVLALALREEEGVGVLRAEPMFSGESTTTVPFGVGRWCQPLFTMHHMDAAQISRMWEFEQRGTSYVSEGAEATARASFPFPRSRNTLG